MKRITVIGAGGWGTALAVHLANHGREVMLWARRPELVRELRETRQNSVYLPDVEIPSGVVPTADLREAAAFSRHMILTVPSQGISDIADQLRSLLTPEHRVLNGAKGLVSSTGQRLSELLESRWPMLEAGALATLSGPNHAEEVARNVPSATVIAAQSDRTIELWQRLLATPAFRVYGSNDVVGVEYAGAIKNVIALATGISDGLGFGDNTKAALVTRGLAEMMRLGLQLGAQPLTFAGLAGLGDLMATCSSRHSRNRRAGEAIGSGVPLDRLLADTRQVIEGVAACRAVRDLALRHATEMPITETVYEILYCGKDPRESVVELMTRYPKQEFEVEIKISSRQSAKGSALSVDG